MLAATVALASALVRLRILAILIGFNLESLLLHLEADLSELFGHLVSLPGRSDDNRDGGRGVEEGKEVLLEHGKDVFLSDLLELLEQVDVVVLRDAFEALVDERHESLVQDYELYF